MLYNRISTHTHTHTHTHIIIMYTSFNKFMTNTENTEDIY